MLITLGAHLSVQMPNDPVRRCALCAASQENQTSEPHEGSSPWVRKARRSSEISPLRVRASGRHHGMPLACLFERIGDRLTESESTIWRWK